MKIEINIATYTPEASLRNPLRLFKDMFCDLIDSRELAWRLAVRVISAQYRKTALGLLWAFTLPLAHTATWIFLNSSDIVNIKETTLPYPAYVFTGTMLWAIFMDTITSPLQQTVNKKKILSKIFDISKCFI